MSHVRAATPMKQVDLLSEHAATTVRKYEVSLAPHGGGGSGTAAAHEPRLTRRRRSLAKRVCELWRARAACGAQFEEIRRLLARLLLWMWPEGALDPALVSTMPIQVAALLSCR